MFELFIESASKGHSRLCLVPFSFGFSAGICVHCDCQHLVQWVKQVLFENLPETAGGSWCKRKQLEGWLLCPSSQTQREPSWGRKRKWPAPAPPPTAAQAKTMGACALPPGYRGQGPHQLAPLQPCQPPPPLGTMRARQPGPPRAVPAPGNFNQPGPGTRALLGRGGGWGLSPQCSSGGSAP